MKNLFNMSEESRNKQSFSKIGIKNPMYGKTGVFHPMFGKHHSETSKEKMRVSKAGQKPWNTGKELSDDHRIKISIAHKGKKLTECHKEKMSISRIGRIVSESTRRKISDRQRGVKRPQYSGDKSPSWKGGCTILYDKIRTCTEYYMWRNGVYERDGFECRVCRDSSGGNLEAHHVKSFSSILRENRIKTMESAVLCNELWDLQNGLTLCTDCHKKTENYGNKENRTFNLQV